MKLKLIFFYLFVLFFVVFGVMEINVCKDFIGIWKIMVDNLFYIMIILLLVEGCGEKCVKLNV